MSVILVSILIICVGILLLAAGFVLSAMIWAYFYDEEGDKYE